jgi:hypothetical protein
VPDLSQARAMGRLVSQPNDRRAMHVVIRRLGKRLDCCCAGIAAPAATGSGARRRRYRSCPRKREKMGKLASSVTLSNAPLRPRYDVTSYNPRPPQQPRQTPPPPPHSPTRPCSR